MIISFSVENFMSFKDENKIEMIKRSEQQHSERIPKVKKFNAKILPVAAIYGGNASGKSNFFKALACFKRIVTNVNLKDDNFPVETFALDKKYKDKPTKFKIEILMDELIYEYEIHLTKNKVLYEKLIKINGNNEYDLFERKGNKIKSEYFILDKGKINIKINNNKKTNGNTVINETEINDNQTFISSYNYQEIKELAPVYNWFKYNLSLLSPNTKIDLLPYFSGSSGKELCNSISNILNKLDTGIVSIDEEKITFDKLPIDNDIKEKIKKDIKNDNEMFRFLGIDDTPLLIRKENGELISSKLISFHLDSNNEKIRFDMKNESDGTKRVIDLIPIFFGICHSISSKVVFIDEIDRSLNTLLLRSLIGSYLNTVNENSRSQIIFTTHDVLLMDQELLRRDEMWSTERKSDGRSELLSFSRFKIRYDKDIRKSYLEGRLGGVPRILFENCLFENKGYSNGKKSQKNKKTKKKL